MHPRFLVSAFAFAALTLTALPALARPPQSGAEGTVGTFRTEPHVIVPQCGGYTGRGYALSRQYPKLLLTRVRAHVEIDERTASTTLQLEIENRGHRPAEAEILLPIPAGATVGHFDFAGAGAEPSARILPADEARRTYRSIVTKLRDPALLEFAGYRLLRTSVFPVEPGKTQSVRIVYDEILEGDGQRVDYTLPRSTALDGVVPWDITVRLLHEVPASAIFSPSHDLVATASEAGTVRLTSSDPTTPGAFHLSYLLDGSDLAGSLFAYPDPSIGGGYFLFMASVPRKASQPQLDREVTLVIDRSGSMAGAKLDQAKNAARRVLEALRPEERFNLITYSNSVELYSRQPVTVAAEREAALRWIDAIQPAGGTNISDALLEALRQPDPGDAVPLVLFLTDGLPTLGKTAEPDIHRIVHLGNRYDRRIYSFGVGRDVNAPLLDRIASMTRAESAYVLPGERIDTTLAKVMRRLDGPVLTKPRLVVLGADGRETTRRIRDCQPDALPDLYGGEQLVVLGQYQGDEPFTLQLHGQSHRGKTVYGFSFDLDRATTQNDFVPRLWASRRIAHLSDAIRQSGAQPAAGNPRRELVDEILRLSTQFGILTEYTAFLATEGSDLHDWNAVIGACSANYAQRAIGTRSGWGAVNQGANFNRMKQSTRVDLYNGFLNDQLERVENRRLRQVNNGAFVYEAGRWINCTQLPQRSRTLSTLPPIAEEVDFGSARYFEIVDRLIQQRRHDRMSLRGRTVIELDGRLILLKQGLEDGC